MKTLAVLCLAVALLFGVDREGDFAIRFEPTAKVQTGAQIPFEIHVNDSLGKPLQDGQVQLAIALPDKPATASVRAWALQPGVYLAKPVFPLAGTWSVTVTARHLDKVSTRSIDFNVAN